MPDMTVAELQRYYRQRSAAAERGLSRTIAAVAAAGDRQATLNVSNGSHKKGTPTPATKGQGPAVISGNLRRNVGHTRVHRVGTTLIAKIGVARGAPYGKHVEKLGYPFMRPVVGFLKTIVIPVAREQFARSRNQ